MEKSFILRSDARGYNRYLSNGPAASYIAGHPEAVVTRHSSLNFHEYQSGRAGFGAMRVFGDEVFSGPGCGYDMHRHHNFIICAFVLQGQLTHVNTVGNVDQLSPGDFYVFSAGSGGKHTELNLRSEDMHAIYMWFVPGQLFLPPSYRRGHFDSQTSRNRLVTLVGEEEGALPIPQELRIRRMVTDQPTTETYRPISPRHGVYAFVLEGELEWNATVLKRRDSAAVWGTEAVTCKTAAGKTDVLFVETEMSAKEI